MLLHKQQIRLTARERAVLLQLTGSDPRHVTTREELKAWVDRYLNNRPGDSDTARQLKAVLRRYLPV
ncbi:MAG: hypothetical protein R3303_06945 [Marinobacter sp.]|nr:hypothetical protein [Marinobacter sp.]